MQFPGWKLAPAGVSSAQGIGAEEKDGIMKRARGPSTKELRQKFLGDDPAPGASSASDVFSDVYESRKTVRVEPRRGDDAKTADLRNGETSIVKG